MSKTNSFPERYILCKIKVIIEIKITDTKIEIKKVLLFTLFKTIGTSKITNRVTAIKNNNISGTIPYKNSFAKIAKITIENIGHICKTSELLK